MSKLQKEAAQITKKESKRKGRGFQRILTDRNNLIIGMFELFFRKNMGVRYFDRGTFFAIIIGLVGLKFLLTFFRSLAFLEGVVLNLLLGDELVPYPLCYVLDGLILLCIGLGIYHLREQQRLRAEGKRINTDYMGTSRFVELGKYIDKENPQFGAYVYIEPLVAFIMSFLVFFNHSLILGILGFIGAGRLWYENYLVVREYRDMMYDMEDAKTLSTHLEQKQEQDEKAIKAAKEKAARAAMPPPIPKKAAPVMPPPIPLVSNPEEEISALDAIRQIKQEQKDEN